MRKIIIAAFYCFAILSCNKKQYQIERPTYGKTIVEINGQQWEEDIKSVIFDKYGRFEFSAFRYKEIDGIWVVFEGLGINDILKNKSKQRIEKNRVLTSNPDSFKLWSSFGTSQDDGDVQCDYYQVLDSDSINNWIQITKEKDDYKEVWGTYSITFLRETGCASSPYTDTLRFRNGVFHFKFE